MRLLIIGTLEGHLGAASRIARDKGARVTQVPTIDAGLEQLRSGKGADLVMVEVTLDVARLMRCLTEERITVHVVGCGVNATSEQAAAAIRAGAKEYIPLPPNEQLIAAVLEAVTEDSREVIYASKAMAEAIRMAEQVAPSDANVLITGESGTGKEVIARHIHQKSKRAAKDLITLNCAAIPENLLESELFGHEKGAFTGAVARRIGKFEEADGGTLLLDEISEMALHLQAKLLRALQEKEIDRVGGSKPIKVNIRVIATSNRNLQEEVRNGRFREDLFFRLNVINLNLPSLRDRKEDIPPLAEHFAKKYAEANGLPFRPLSAAAMEKLRQHTWRGNVRELENTLHRAVLLASGEEIGPDAVILTGYGEAGEETAGAAPTIKSLVGKSMADVEQELILETLHHCLGNRTHAANILGISIRTLRNKLKQYSDTGAKVPPPRDGDERAANG